MGLVRGKLPAALIDGKPFFISALVVVVVLEFGKQAKSKGEWYLLGRLARHALIWCLCFRQIN
ncbi:MAG: hypothetical protein ACI9ON_002707 [Limisphaerales bacterium]